MDRRYRRPGVPVALAWLSAALVLGSGAGTSLAAGAEPAARMTELVEAGLLAKAAGCAGTGQAASVPKAQRRPLLAGLRRGPLDRRLDPRTGGAVAVLHRAATLEAAGPVDSLVRMAMCRGAKQRSGTPSGQPVGPQALQGPALSPVVIRAAAGAHTVGRMPALVLTAVALLLGALCGVLVTRVNRAHGSAGPAGSEQDREQQEEDLAESGKAAHPQARIRSVTTGAPRGSLRVVGYVSVPEVNGDDVAAVAQADAIQRLCEQHGWELLRVVRDVENGRTKGLERPGLLYALDRIAHGEASCLVVSHLERLTRSAADLGRIVEWFERSQGRLVAIDLRLDTGSAEGRLTARTLVAVGEWEGRRIADQTKKGLAAARARRATTGPPTVDDRPGLKEYILTLRNQGMTLQAIADRLNAEGIPTLRGGTKWRPSSVHGALGYRRPSNKHPIGKGQRQEKQAP